jgi:hypothetical protein
VAPPNDPDRVHAEEALEVYLPRSVYALFTLINKLDALSLTPSRRRALEALLLRLCDQANTLWPVPTARERPRQLTIPPRFRENNLWLALESGIKVWTGQSAHIPLTIWPQLPPSSGGICLFEGRLRDLCDQLRERQAAQLPIQAVLTALPRPNQAFWTLSALWAGWLWGREAVGPFKSVLRRRRYDWNWHTAGLYHAFTNLAELLPAEIPLLGLIGEVEPGFLTAALLGADLAGFELVGLALRSGSEGAQIHWKSASLTPSNPLQRAEVDQILRQTAASSAEDFLKASGQPASYLPMHSAALLGIVRSRVMRSRWLQPASPATGPPAGESIQPAPEEESSSPPEQFTRVMNGIRDAVSFRGGFLRYGATDSPETGHWWLRSTEGSSPPQADRVERFLVNFLVRQDTCSFSELSHALLEKFPSLLTPPSELFQVCLDSYATPHPSDPDHWSLRPQESPASRRQDLADVQAQLHLLAERLEYRLEGQMPLRWLDAHGETRCWIYPIASAVIGEIILGLTQPLPSPPERSLIVLPGSRANLVAYKLRHNPHLRSLCAAGESGAAESSERTGWRFVKFRQVRSLLENPLLRRDNFDDLLALDPLTYTAPQMRLF